MPGTDYDCDRPFVLFRSLADFLSHMRFAACLAQRGRRAARELISGRAQRRHRLFDRRKDLARSTAAFDQRVPERFPVGMTGDFGETVERVAIKRFSLL